MAVSFQDIMAKKQELDAIMHTYGEQAIKDLLTDFFNTHPYVQAIGWRQYTPYFNDGDECVFSVHDPAVRVDPLVYDAFSSRKYVSLEEYTAGEDDLYTGYLEAWDLVDSPLKTDLVQLAAVICGNREVMKIALGDHVKVVATREAITVTDYDHE